MDLLYPKVSFFSPGSTKHFPIPLLIGDPWEAWVSACDCQMCVMKLENNNQLEQWLRDFSYG